MSEHAWDEWAHRHGLPTRQAAIAKRETYRCLACDGNAFMSGEEMGKHLEVVHGLKLPITPRPISVAFLDGPDFHAIDTTWEYGAVRIVQRRRTG